MPTHIITHKFLVVALSLAVAIGVGIPFADDIYTGNGIFYRVLKGLSTDNTDPTPASFTWTIVTPSEVTQELIEDVEALNLERGIENSLIARLNSTIRSLENGNVRAAINSLQAFINTVEAQAGNNIPQEDADRLIASAQSIIDALSSS